MADPSYYSTSGYDIQVDPQPLGCINTIQRGHEQQTACHVTAHLRDEVWAEGGQVALQRSVPHRQPVPAGGDRGGSAPQGA